MSTEEIYKAAKLDANGDPRGSKTATVEDEAEEDDAAGPELPPDFTAEEDVPDDEEGRFFGGGVTRATASALDFIDQRESSGVGVNKYSLSVSSLWDE
jgi:beta-catenin-like protein 1